MRPRHHSNSQAIDISEKAGVRYLHTGSDWVQGAMRVARPWALELAYTREMMAALLMRPESHRPRRVLLIGLGAGSQAKFIYRHLLECRLTAVEISPQVEMVARQYFHLPDDPRRLRVIIADAAEYVLAGGESYDLILCDGFDADARSGALDTSPFYQGCRARLKEDGLLSVNLLGRNRGAQASFERIREAFDGRAVAFPPCDSGNIAVFAAVGARIDASLEDLRGRAEKLKEATGLDLQPALARLQHSPALAGERLLF